MENEHELTEPLLLPDWACQGQSVALVCQAVPISPGGPLYKEEGLWKWPSGGGTTRGNWVRFGPWEEAHPSLQC